MRHKDGGAALGGVRGAGLRQGRADQGRGARCAHAGKRDVHVSAAAGMRIRPLFEQPSAIVHTPIRRPGGSPAPADSSLGRVQGTSRNDPFKRHARTRAHRAYARSGYRATHSNARARARMLQSPTCASSPSDAMMDASVALSRALVASSHTSRRGLRRNALGGGGPGDAQGG